MNLKKRYLRKEGKMLKKFHKQFLIIFAISSMIFLMSGNTAIAETWDVYPAMTRVAIQAVVDSASDGDSIYFQAGTYDWSNAPLTVRGAINVIEKSLIIKGEPDTIIVGRESVDPTGTDPEGVNAFYVQDLDLDNDVTFDGLNFQTFLRGIKASYITIPPGEHYFAEPNARNITVKNCTFSDIHRDAISLSNVRGNILIQNNEMQTGRMGMFIDWYWSENNEDWQPEDSYVQILGNKINSNGWGIYLAMTTNVVVKQNTISCERIGIWNNYARKGTVVSENSLFNCFAGIRIFGSWEYGTKYEAEGAVIKRNKLIDISGLGIVIAGDASFGHTVSNNEIHMAPGSRVGIYTCAHDSYYGQNKISGSGNYAFLLDQENYIPSGGFIAYAHHETLQANNVSQFSPYWRHFYLYYGTHDNLVVGSGMGLNTYFDNGYDNRITGATPMAGGIGQDLSEAIKERNEELKEARIIQH
jgi:parallel beta-helix repeat protein